MILNALIQYQLLNSTLGYIMHLILITIILDITILRHIHDNHLLLRLTKSNHQINTVLFGINSQIFGQLRTIDTAEHAAAKSLLCRTKHHGLGHDTIIGKLIDEQFTTFQNWNLGSAIALVLLVIMFISMFVTGGFKTEEARGSAL